MSVTNRMPKKTGVTDNSAFFSLNRNVIRRDHAASNNDNFKSIHQRGKLNNFPAKTVLTILPTDVELL